MERSELSNDLVYQLSGPAPAEPRACELRHVRLPPYDLAVGGDLPKFQELLKQTAEGIYGASHGEKIAEGSPGLIEADERVIEAYFGR